MRQIEASGGVEFRPDPFHRLAIQFWIVSGFALLCAVTVGLRTGLFPKAWIFVPLFVMVPVQSVRSWRRARSWAFATDQDLLLMRGARTARWFAWEEIAAIRLWTRYRETALARSVVEVLTLEGEIIDVWGTAGGEASDLHARRRLTELWSARVGPRDEAEWPRRRPESGMLTLGWIVAIGVPLINFMVVAP
ncbi:MAG: hypothetical protein AAGE98_14330 [Actinomycetota bacterium]